MSRRAKSFNARVEEHALRALRAACGAERLALRERLQSLWGGYGELLRVDIEGGSAASAIVKLMVPPRVPEGAAAERSHRRKLRSYEVEAQFYGRYAPDCAEDCRVPRAYLCEKSEEGFLLLLEDLDDAGFHARRSRVSTAELHACLEWLACFHATFLGRRPDGLWASGTYWHLATRPDELSALQNAALRAAAPRIDRRLRRARHRTLVHGDAKLENFCFSPSTGNVAAVDFQYVGGGVGVQDVAYFLDSCLSPAECERDAPRLLAHYFQELRRALLRRRAASPSESAIDAGSVEDEWRSLYPVARVDFHRFLLGWAPGSADHDSYAERLTRELLASLEAWSD